MAHIHIASPMGTFFLLNMGMLMKETNTAINSCNRSTPALYTIEHNKTELQRLYSITSLLTPAIY